MLDVRNQFPALTTYAPDLAYLDSAASALKPRAVIDAMAQFMATDYANIHRGLYRFSQASTTAYETARTKLARFLGAKDNEIVFTRNATESINLVANSWGRANLKSGDVVLISALEHHANIVPWQMITQAVGARIEVIPLIEGTGQLDLAAYHRLLSECRPKLVALCHMSNALGSLQPIKDMASTAKASCSATVLLDGCQAVVHERVDVVDLGCDFYVFSGHKLYGPSGIGVLYGRYELLCDMPPYQGGGDMIERVDYDRSTYTAPPARFEAGTPAIVEAIGLGAAVDWLESLGWEKITAHEAMLTAQLEEKLNEIKGLTHIGKAPVRGGIVSFLIDGISPQDIGILLDKQGIAVRVGHHCAMPLMKSLGIGGTVRASLGIYNQPRDIDNLIHGLKKIITMMR